MSYSPPIVLLEGDPYLARDRLTAIKSVRHPSPPGPSEWVDFSLPQDKGGQTEFIEKGINVLHGELSYPTWDGSPKTVLVRGLFSDQRLLNFLFKYASSPSSEVMLVIWDEEGVISSDRSSKKDLPTWKDFRKLCSDKGKAFNFGLPLSDYEVKNEERISYVVSVAKKAGKNISGEDAETLIGMVGADRGMIISEMGKLAVVVDGPNITEKDLHEHVMPLSVEYPVWKFYFAFNSGVYKHIIEAADILLKNGMSHDAILGLALRQARWHVLAAHAAAEGKDIMTEMHRFISGEMNPKDIKGLPSYAFVKDDDKKDSAGKAPSPTMLSDIISVVRNITSRKVKCHSPAKEAYNVTLSNYWWLYDSAAEARLATEHEAALIFDIAIRAYVEMRPIEDMLEEKKNKFLAGG